MIMHPTQSPPASTDAWKEQLPQVRPRPALPPLQPVEAIAQAVLATPGVLRLLVGRDHAGTPLVQRQVRGIREVDHGFEVRVVLTPDSHLLLTVEAIRASVQALVPGRLDVTVESVGRRRGVAR